MINVTFSGKNIVCPHWNIKVCLNGKYRLTENPDNPYEATSMFATCPIIENSKLSLHKQENELKLMRCPYDMGCEYLRQFKEKIDIRNDGFSQ